MSAINRFDPSTLPAGPLQQVAPLLAALTPPQLLPVNMDCSTVASVAIAVSSRIQPFRDDATKLPFFDVAAFDNLRPLGEALAQAQALCELQQNEVKDNLGTLVDRARELNEVYRLDIAMLIGHKILPAPKDTSLPKSVGHKNVADELRRNSLYLKENWKKIQGLIPLSFDDVEKGSALAAELLATLGERSLEAESPVNEIAQIRQRVLTATVLCHRQIYRAIDYLRFDQGDARQIVPGLRGTTRAGTKAEDDDETGPEPLPLDIPIPIDSNKIPGGPGGNPFTE